MHSLHSTTNGSSGTTIVTLGRGGTVTANDPNERTVSTVNVTQAELNQSGIVTIAGGNGSNGTTSIAFTDSEGNIIGTSVIDSAALNGSLSGSSNGSVTVVADGDPNLGSHFLTTGSDTEGGISLAKLTTGSNITIGAPMPVMTVSGNDAVTNKRNITKMEVVDPTSVSVPALEVVVPKQKKGSNVPENEKKVCLWPTGNGTTCGKTFVKFDSLKRHLTEAHKGVRPFACKLCDKTYGRRDYLQRHLKSHNASYATNLTNPGGGGGGRGNSAHHNVGTVNAAVASGAMPQISFANSNVVQGSRIQLSPTKIKTPSLANNPTNPSNSQAGEVVLSGGGSVSVILQQGPDGQLTLIQQPTTISSPGNSILSSGSSNAVSVANRSSPVQQTTTNNTLTSLPFFNLTTSMQPTKPLGSKICRWVQDDGTVCGKAFSKLDSLRRHVNELHKGVRPFACSVCDKNYGRRDYLDRHMKTHDPETQSKRIKLTSNTAAGLVDWVVNSGKQNLASGEKGNDRGLTGIKDNDRESGNDDPNDSDGNDTGESPARVIKKKRRDIPAEEKKICLWVLEDGTACGKTFTKFDSLKRHVSEGHKNVRPFGCTLCGKSYGRRDYLLRHLRSHNEAELAAISAGGSDVEAITSPSSGNTHMITINNAGSLNSGNSSNTTSPGGISLSNSIGNGNSPATNASFGGSPNRSIGFLQISGTPNSSSTIRLPQQPVQQTSTSLAGGGGITGSAGISHKLVVSGNNFSVHSGMGRKRSDDKKTCRWVLDNGTICGRSFSKFDSLRRHVQELHKGVRPFVCNLCDKSYGRKDYLDRHMKSHTSTNSDNPSNNTTTDVSIEDVKFEHDSVITSSPSLSIPQITTSGATIITTTGSLMTKSDMIGAVDDDDDEITDHEGIRVQVQRSRVGIVMDDDDDNDPNGVVRGVLDDTPPGVVDNDEDEDVETTNVLQSHTSGSSSSNLSHHHSTRLASHLTRDHPELTADVVTDDM